MRQEAGKNSISISHVGKCYKIYPSPKERLKEWLLPFSRRRHQEKWVLKDINLEVAAGEAVGIIGMNGAGKSTLLKIITGTTVPTTGEVHFEGRVSALLELGLGFHPDFSGRDNAYMSGQLLGYTIEEIDACMQQIEDFAEIGPAMDGLVRTYSSGMQVRLAFAVATMKRPDILIVDEALSVGDSYFQHKSFSRIKEFCDQGTTLLLVSHDKAAIQAACSRAVLLDHGEILKLGTPEEIMDYYNAMLADKSGKSIEQKVLPGGRVQTISGSRKARIISVTLRSAEGQPLQVAEVGEPVTLEVEAEVMDELPSLACGFMIRNRFGEPAYGTNTANCGQLLQGLRKGERLRFSFAFPMNLGRGNYAVSVALHGSESHVDANYEWRDLAAVFEVLNQARPVFEGAAFLDAEVRAERI